MPFDAEAFDASTLQTLHMDGTEPPPQRTQTQMQARSQSQAQAIAGTTASTLPTLQPPERGPFGSAFAGEVYRSVFYIAPTQCGDVLRLVKLQACRSAMAPPPPLPDAAATAAAASPARAAQRSAARAGDDSDSDDYEAMAAMFANERGDECANEHAAMPQLPSRHGQQGPSSTLPMSAGSAPSAASSQPSQASQATSQQKRKRAAEGQTRISSRQKRNNLFGR